MDRRSFLRRASLVAAGVVAADQLELLERLTHVRRLFPSAALSDNWRRGFLDSLPSAQLHGLSSSTYPEWASYKQPEYDWLQSIGIEDPTAYCGSRP